MAWEHTARAGAHPAGMQRPRGGQWAVAARGLVKTFGDHRAVNGLDLYGRPGTGGGPLGPHGAGTTTTIPPRPDAGSAQIFGYDVVKEAAAVRRLIAVTGQYATVDESLTAAENLTIFARLLGLDRAEARRRTAQLLEEFGLAEAAHRPLKHFS